MPADKFEEEEKEDDEEEDEEKQQELGDRGKISTREIKRRG